jgi:spore coat polysaccharide biosynthesis protein SpsF
LSTVAIIQARMGSTRLPGKVLMNLAGEPMLARCVNRVVRAVSVDGVVVATTIESSDDPVEDLCRSRGWNFFRGSQGDVLDRYYRAAAMFGADTVVRITSDCPLIEPEIIDLVSAAYQSALPAVDYASNTLTHRTFPRGLDTEVFSLAALRAAWTQDSNLGWREHVTPFIYRNPEQFRTLNVTCETDWSGLRWTVDTVEDLEFVRRVYDEFGHDRFTWREVLVLLDRQPELVGINSRVGQKAVV